MRRVLAADTPKGVATLQTILGTELEILEAHTLEEAALRMSDGVAVIICGIHFAESRMYDLLRLAQANPLTRSIPFICFRDMDSDLNPPILEGLEIACKALGATAFVDLFRWKQIQGIANADIHFRAFVLASIQEA